MRVSKAVLPYLGLLTGVICLSFSAIFVRWANAPGIVMAFWRMLTALVVLAPFFWQRVRRLEPKPTRGDIGLALLGGLMIALDHGTWNTALQYTSIANGTLFNNLSPLWVALIAWLLWRERLRLGFWIGLAVTLVGTLLVFGSSLLREAQFNLGDGIAIVSSLFYALYFLVTQRARRRMQTLVYIWLAVCGAAAALFITSLAFGLPLTGYSAETYLACIAAGLVSQVAGYFAVGYSLGHLPASVVSPTMTAQPLVTMLLAIPLAGEALSPLQILGGLGVMAGIYLVNRAGNSTDEGKIGTVKDNTALGDF